MSRKSIKALSWTLFIFGIVGIGVFGYFTYANYQILVENQIWEQRWAVVEGDVITPAHEWWNPIIEGHTAYQAAFSAITWNVIGLVSIVAGLFVIEFILQQLNLREGER